ncbi:hypothetical protein FHG87_001893 [Trinorchestia longiramus]|nr:hypothetical protein FHG87_001893 [Trinorchestia longiramus]
MKDGEESTSLPHQSKEVEEEVEEMEEKEEEEEEEEEEEKEEEEVVVKRYVKWSLFLLPEADNFPALASACSREDNRCKSVP